MNSLVIFFVGLIAISAEQASESSIDIESKISMNELMGQHLLMSTFADSYDPAAIRFPETNWSTWEEVYFNQEVYRTKLVEQISVNWSVGSWWWMADVSVDSTIAQGGPITFTLKYPLVDWRENLKFIVTKDPNGETKTTIVGQYYTPRHGYLVATLIMLPLILFSVFITFMSYYGIVSFPPKS